MDFNTIMTDAFSAGVIAPLVSLVVLPIIYRFVGVTKRERREREQMALRMTMDLARGLKDLAEATNNAAARSEYHAMREHVLSDFQDKAQAHFIEERKLRENPDRRYWLLPWPRGLFGWVWSLMTVVFAALFMMITVGIFWAAYTDATTSIGIRIAGVLFVAAIMVAPVLLFRWWAFMSARMGQSRPSQSQSMA